LKDDKNIEYRFIKDTNNNIIVTNTGIVYNIKRNEILNHLYPYKRYETVTINSKECKVHRLVAEYFCDGYFDGATVNHKDCNKLNNNSYNLEWCTASYNIKHAHLNNLCKVSKRVVLCTKDNKVIRKFNSMTEAGKYLNMDRRTVRSRLTGKKKKFVDGEYSIFTIEKPENRKR
jgi:hypothetical protein